MKIELMYYWNINSLAAYLHKQANAQQEYEPIRRMGLYTTKRHIMLEEMAMNGPIKEGRVTKLWSQ